MPAEQASVAGGNRVSAWREAPASPGNGAFAWWVPLAALAAGAGLALLASSRRGGHGPAAAAVSHVPVPGDCGCAAVQAQPTAGEPSAAELDALEGELERILAEGMRARADEAPREVGHPARGGPR